MTEVWRVWLEMSLIMAVLTAAGYGVCGWGQHGHPLVPQPAKPGFGLCASVSPLCVCTAHAAATQFVYYPSSGSAEMTTTATTPTKPGGYEVPPPDKKNLSVTLMWPGAKPAKANETWNIHVPKVGSVVAHKSVLQPSLTPFGCACLSLKPRHSCGFCT